MFYNGTGSQSSDILKVDQMGNAAKSNIQSSCRKSCLTHPRPLWPFFCRDQALCIDQTDFRNTFKKHLGQAHQHSDLLWGTGSLCPSGEKGQQSHVALRSWSSLNPHILISCQDHDRMSHSEGLDQAPRHGRSQRRLYLFSSSKDSVTYKRHSFLFCNWNEQYLSRVYMFIFMPVLKRKN